MLNKKKTKIFRGFITERDYAEDYDVLFIGNSDDPFAELMEDYKNSHVSIIYWTSSQKQTKDQMIEGHVNHVFGIVDAKYIAHYSDLTGYLWTDEELNIGGHDLLEELRTHKDRFIYMEITKHS